MKTCVKWEWKCMLSDLRQRRNTSILILKHYTLYIIPCCRLANSKRPIFSATCILRNISRIPLRLFLKWGAWKIRTVGASMAAAYYWKASNALFLSFAHYKFTINNGGRWSGLRPWSFIFGIFPVDFHQKRLFSLFRACDMKYHHFFP